MLFGESKVEIVAEPYKAPVISPFDFINSINHTKEELIVDDWSEKQYIPYLVNRGLSFGPDTVIAANEMNSRPHIDKKLQYHFLINSIRPKKRYNKWLKATQIESIEVIKQYYGYSTEKARQVITLFDQSTIKNLKQKLEKGGMRNDKRVLQD
jgi:hypothetical protein